MRGFFLNLGLMVVLVFALYRGLMSAFPVLPWEKPTVSPSPTASGSPAPTAAHGPLRIGVGDRPAYLLLASLPFWLQNKPPVEIIKVPDTNQRWAMLAAGQLDLACGTVDSFALALLRYKAGTYIASLGTSAGEDVLLGTGIDTLADLKHKSIAVPAGHEYVVGLALSQIGLSPSETTLVATNTDQDAATALNKHAVQAALLWEPQLSQSREGTTVVFSTADVKTGAKTLRIEEMFAARPDVLNRRRAEVEAVLRAYFKAVDTLRTKPGLARDPIARATGVSIDVLGDYLKTVQFASLTDNRSVDPTIVTGTLSDEQGDLKMMGQTGQTQSDLSTAVDMDIVKQLPPSHEEQEGQ